jgi:hypothetical protein
MPNAIPAPILYRHALDPFDKLVDISSVTSEARSGPFHCLVCERQMIPVLRGVKRQKHFRHQVETNCSGETYLHLLGKRFFYQVYSQCVSDKQPFTLVFKTEVMCTTCQDEQSISCDLDPELKERDLPRYYPKIRLEVPEGGFIPDLLLESSQGDKIFVEIAVTHVVEDSKRSSGYRVIELRLETEDDLAPILDRRISQEDSRVSLLNFKIGIRKLSLQTCIKKFSFFLVRKDGWAAIRELHPLAAKKVQAGPEIVYSRRLRYSSSDTYCQALEEAYHQQIQIKNCFLCRYHGKNINREDNDVPIYCRFLKKACRSVEAVACQYYRVDPKVFPSQHG